MKQLASEVPTQRDLARIFGVSEALISKLMRSRVLRRGGTLAEQVQAWVQREVESNGPPASTELEAERVALTRARRHLAEIEVGKARGDTVPVDSMVALLASNNHVARQVLLSWVGKLPPVLQHSTPPEIAKVLEEEIYQVLSNMSLNYPRYVLRVLRWLVKHAPADLWQVPNIGEDELLGAIDARLAEQADLEAEHIVGGDA